MGDIVVVVGGSAGSRSAARTAAGKGTGLRAVGAWQYPVAIIPSHQPNR